jgi:beta-glucanase (GH16 family)
MPRTRTALAVLLAGFIALAVFVFAGRQAVSRVSPSGSEGEHRTAPPTASHSASTSGRPSPSTVQPTATPRLITTFADDFDGNQLDKTRWETDGEWGCCGLSTESDHLAGKTVTVSDGILHLRAQRGPTKSGRKWQSALVTTRGLFSQRYGVFQARMRWTKGSGLWPAFWLLEADATGPRPELDLVEDYPQTKDPGSVSEYVVVNHYRDRGGTLRIDKLTIDAQVDLTADYHVYEVEWRPSQLIVRLDGEEVGRLTSPPPSKPMFLVLDMVVGSPLGHSDDSTPSPASLDVDWVRVSK